MDNIYGQSGEAGKIPSALPGSLLPYQDPTLAVSDRVADLLGRMTTEEKLAQLNGTLAWPYYERTANGVELSAEGREKLSVAGLGGLYGLLRADPWTGVTAKTGLTPAEGAELVIKIQEFVRQNTRLGIPAFVIAEANHGYMALRGTIGPSPLTATQAWSTNTWSRFISSAGKEAKAQGNSVVFCPNIDLGRDPRWGRTEETLGEDPCLAGRFCAASVAALQNTGLAACAKHFVHGSPRSGLNTGSAHMGEHELHETCLRPFRDAIAIGTRGIMPSYNDIDGEPCSGSKRLLTDLLRGELGFEGVTFSDVAALGMLVSPYRRAGSLAEAAALALEAGIDFETAQTNLYDKPLAEALEQGLTSIATIDRSVARILSLKFELGLFDEPWADPVRATSVMGCKEHRQYALDIARESIVLLKNEGDLLPLSKELGSVAVIGPNADNVYNQLGDYTPPQLPGETVTVLQGIRQLIDSEKVVYAKGCTVRGDSKEGFEQAIKAAETADATVLVLGGSSARDFEIDELDRPDMGAMTSDRTSPDVDCGEGLDRSTLGLLGVQLELAKAIHALGKPLVVVLICGRPMEIEWLRANIPSILLAGYPGQEGGTAVAETLFGDNNPAGRLTMTWPKSVGQLPLNYNAKPGVRNSYIDQDREPAFRFGHGLSYSSFRCHNLRSQQLGPQHFHFMVDITNTSSRDGDEVIQVYIRDEVSSVTRPERELKDFR
ncbi:MAG: glycoside hydrolase family 3 N-terminal domain-containing protein, partial [bacterium]